MKKQQDGSTILWLENGASRFTYFAFISYKHQDKKWSKWIQRRLESYSLPNKLREERDIPRRITPIFRDETDLTGGKAVGTLLTEKLEQCKYLIVICSRHMQNRPEYINYEIEQFLALGRPKEHIIPIIVDGKAVAVDPNEEALPPALLHMGEDRPLGIVVDRKNLRETLLKLVAIILEIDLINLRSHDELVRKKRTIYSTSAATVMTLGLSAFLAWNVLSVTQSQMRERNTYAWNEYKNGDRLQALETAQGVIERGNWPIDSEIYHQAKRIETLSNLIPKYSSYSVLEEYTANSRSMFVRDENAVMIISEQQIRRYDLNGELMQAFNVGDYGDEIVEVSADGRHALIKSTYSKGVIGTALWLVDLWEDRPKQLLVSSDRYDRNLIGMSNYLNVVSGEFSADGRYLSAYRTGGYYNANDELAIWDVETGEKICELDASLLDGDANYGQGRVVENFEFIDSCICRWTGEKYDVYYHLGSGEIFTVERAMTSEAMQWGSVQDGRYFVSARGDIIDFGEMREISYSLEETESVMVDACRFFDGRYVVMPIIEGEDPAGISKVVVVDIKKEEVVAGVNVSIGVGLLKSMFKQIRVLRAEGTDRIYLILNETTHSEDEIALFRFDLTENETIHRILIPQGIDEALLGDVKLYYAFDDRDVLMARTGEDSIAIEINGENIANAYRLDGYLHGDIQFSHDIRAPRMLAIQNGSYMLYTLEELGKQVDAELFEAQEEAVWAVSSDGSSLVKAVGTRWALWRNEELVTYQSDLEVLDLSFSRDGETLLLTCSDRLVLCDISGNIKGVCLIDDGKRRFVSARFMGDSGKILALDEAIPDFFADSHGRLTIIDGEELSFERIVCEEICLNVDDLRYAYDVSQDGNRIAAIETLRYENGSSYRVITVWNAEGELLARTTNLQPEGEKTFEIVEHGGVGGSFSYVSFSGTNRILAGMTQGVWVFDAIECRTLGYVMDAGIVASVPRLLKNGMVIYPTKSLHVWNFDQDILEQALPLNMVDPLSEKVVRSDIVLSRGVAIGNLLISEDENWCAATGCEYTMIYNTEDFGLNGRLANKPVYVLYLNEQKIVYDTGEGLYVFVGGVFDEPE